MTVKPTMATSHAEAITPELLDALRSHPDLPDDAWYLIVVTALCVLNRPEGIPKVYTHAIGTRASSGSSGSSGHGTTINDAEVADEREQLRIARRMREALLKTSAIGGLPKTINALQELKKVVPAHMLDEPPQADGEGDAPSPTNRRRDVYATPTSTVLERGRAFFDKCYGKVAGRVMTSLDHSGTEDLGLAVRLTYGYVLSTTAILAEAETSFVMIAGLIPQDVNPQLKGHLRGALNGGANVEQVRAVRHVAIRVCEAAGMRVLSERDAPGGWVWRTEVQDL